MTAGSCPKVRCGRRYFESSPTEFATISLLSKLRDLRLAFFDVETTGASPRLNDRITEVGLRIVEGGQVVEDYQQLINPQRSIPQSIVELTGITRAMVEKAPTFEELEYDIARRLKGAVVIGHNVRFDLGFLKSELDRTATRFDELIDCSKVIDTVRLARKAFGRRGNGLQKLAARLNIVVQTAHRALADAVTTAHVFDHIVSLQGGYDLCLAQAIALQGGACRFFGQAGIESMPLGLEEAVRRRDHVRMIYLDSQNNRTERIVVPLEIRATRRATSVCAFCTLHQERRMFDVARIIALTRIETLYDDVSSPAEPVYSIDEESQTSDE